MESLAGKIQNHLADVARDPSIPFDPSLLGSLDRHLSDALPKEVVIGLITQIAGLLPTLRQDPAPATSLAEILADSSSFTFADVLAIEPPLPFVDGLSVGAPAFNLVTLSLLEKTGNSPSEVGIIAGKLDVVTALINLWLRTESMSVATKAYNVLSLLLGTENPEQMDPDLMAPGLAIDLSSPTSGLMWRRVVTDKDVYSLFFSLCSLRTVGQPGQPSKKQKTIAQGRLLDFLKDFCHAPQVWSSNIPEIESKYGVSKDGGLLEFAAVHMVDYKDDPLMHVSLVDFFTALLSNYDGNQARLNDSPHSSKALDFMISSGLHSRTIDYFLKPDEQDPLDITWLYPASSRYLAAYVSAHSRHFLEVALDTSSEILQHILYTLKGTTRGELANDRAPKDELRLLLYLPRLSLLQTTTRESPLLLLPLKPVNADVLITLGRIFKGSTTTARPQRRKGVNIDDPASSAASMSILQERAAARTLFLLYLGQHPSFWDDLIATASLVALKSTAKAALSLLHCLIDAEWATASDVAAHSSSATFHSSPTSTPTSSITSPTTVAAAPTVPSEQILSSACHIYHPSPLPKTGLSSLLLSPAIEKVVPYLLKEGTENASEEAFEVAGAKYEVLLAFLAGLEGMVGAMPESAELVEGLLGAVRRRVGGGVLGNRGRGGDEGGGGGGLGVATESR